MAALFGQSLTLFIEGSPSAGAVGPPLTLAGQVWSLSLFSPAALGGCSPSVFVLRLSVPAASCRTLSCCSFLPRFLPLALVQAGVWGLGSCLGPPFFFFGGGGGLSFPCPRWFLLFQPFYCPGSLVFSAFLPGFTFLSLPVFADSSGWLTYGPCLCTLRCLAMGGLTLFLCQGPVGLPFWGCGVSGFLGPAGFRVFTRGSPVSGRDCVLPQSAIVMKTFPPSGGFGYRPSCGGPISQVGAVFFSLRSYRRLSLLLAGLVMRLRVGFPFSGTSVRGYFPPLLGMGALPPIPLCIPSGCGHPLSRVCLFATLARVCRFPFLCGVPVSFIGSSELIVAGSCTLALLVFLILASDLSSSGLICCYTASLASVAWLSGDCPPTFDLAVEFVPLFTFLRSLTDSGSCGFSFPIWLASFTMGSPLRGRGW